MTARTAEGAGRNTIGRELAIAKLVLRSSSLERSPLDTVKRMTVKVKPKRTITAAEDRRLRKALRAIDPEIHDLYVVGVGTLLRRENLIYLQRGEHRGDRLVLDLAGLEYISSAGLRVLMLASRDVKSREGTLTVCGLQPIVREIFEISRFNVVFHVLPDRNAALTELRVAAPAGA